MVAQDAEKIKVVDKLKAEFGDRAFSGNDVAKLLGTDPHGTGGLFKYMLARREVHKIRSGAYQFVSYSQATPAPIAPVETPSAPQAAASEVLNTPPLLARIGEFYLSEHMLLIVHTGNQEGSPALRFYTTIIEVDPATKHPRNKVINFIKSRDPREYAQAIAWLDGMAGEPPHAVDDTALELAADLEKQLNAAKQEIADLKSKIDAIRGMFRGEL